MRDTSLLTFAIGAILRPEMARIGDAGPELKSCPNVPTVHTLNDALLAQFP